jgi:DNA processing protein
VVGVVVQPYYPLVALRLIEGVSDADCFGLPADHERTFSMLQTANGRRDLGRLIGAKIPDIPWDEFRTQIDMIAASGARVMTFHDPEYPRFFFQIPEPPPILLYKGDRALLLRRGVAIVGSRDASLSGCKMASSIARDLAVLGVMVVSGLALGIDAAAHRGVLEGEGKTVGVIGTGIDVPYPRSNVGLSRAIAKRGCLVTEQLMGITAKSFVFPRRNRIISALSRMVVVVEAAQRSGALLTAKWALEQGRDIGAVPRFPQEPRSRGVNGLLKTGAGVVESVDDIIAAVPEVVPGGRPVAASAPARSTQPSLWARPAGLSTKAKQVYDVLGGAPVDVDAVAAHVGKAVDAIQPVLLDLEMRGLIARDTTGAYYRV